MNFSSEQLSTYCDRALAGLLYLLVILTPFSIAATSILPAAMVLVVIVKKLLKPDFAAFKAPDLLIFYAFLAFSLLSVVNSGPYTAKTLSFFFGRWLKNALIFLLVQDILSKYSRVKKIIGCFLGTGIILSLDGFFQKYWGYDIFAHQPLVDVGRGLSGISATFGNYNSLGILLAVLLLFAISLLIPKRSWDWPRAVMLPLIVLFVYGLYWTYSRGSWVAVILGMIAIVFLSKRFYIAFFVLAAFLGCLFLSPRGWERFLFIFQTGGDQGRYAYWKIAWHLVQQHPVLGNGLGTFGPRFFAETPIYGKMYAHNSFLQIWAEAGFLSIFSLVVFLLWNLTKSAKTLWKHCDAYLLALFCGSLGWLVRAFFDNDFYSVQLSALFWLLLGTLRSTEILVRNQRVNSKQ